MSDGGRGLATGDGGGRWRRAMEAGDGSGRWQRAMAAGDGSRRWRRAKAACDGGSDITGGSNVGSELTDLW